MSLFAKLLSRVRANKQTEAKQNAASGLNEQVSKTCFSDYSVSSVDSVVDDSYALWLARGEEMDKSRADISNLVSLPKPKEEDSTKEKLRLLRERLNKQAQPVN